MRLKNICKFAIDGIIVRKKTFIFAIIMLVTSIVMINLTFLQINSAFFLKLKIEDVLNEKMPNIIYSYCDENFNKSYISFLENMKRQEYVESYGFYRYEYNQFNELQNNEQFLKLYKKNNKYMDDMSEDAKNSVQVLYIDDTLAELCDIYDINGNKITYKSKDEYIPIYVGYDYRNIIDVGSIITSKTMVKKNNKFVYEKIQFKVQGILKKESYWLEDMTIESMSNCINLDSSFVTFKSYNINEKKDRCFYVVNNQKNVEGAIDLMNKSVAINNLNMKIATVDDDVNKKLKSDIEDMKVYIVLATFITFMAILSNSAMSTVAILLRKKDFGVLYVNGISRKDVRRIVLCENIIKIAISIIISFSYVYYSLFMNYGGRNPVMLENLLYVQTRMTIFEIMGIGILILFISSMVPLLIIRKLNVIELIGGND